MARQGGRSRFMVTGRCFLEIRYLKNRTKRDAMHRCVIIQFVLLCGLFSLAAAGLTHDENQPIIRPRTAAATVGQHRKLFWGWVFLGESLVSAARTGLTDLANDFVLQPN